MEIFAKLGIEWKLLLAQAINFGVLFWVLRRYAYQPMLDFLEKRTERIEQGLKDAQRAQATLSEMVVKEKELLGAARAEARNIIAGAEASAKQRDTERRAETEKQIALLLADAEKSIQAEEQKVLASAKKEIGALVVLAVEKVLQEKMDSAQEKEFLEKLAH